MMLMMSLISKPLWAVCRQYDVSFESSTKLGATLYHTASAPCAQASCTHNNRGIPPTNWRP